MLQAPKEEVTEYGVGVLLSYLIKVDFNIQTESEYYSYKYKLKTMSSKLRTTSKTNFLAITIRLRILQIRLRMYKSCRKSISDLARRAQL